MDFGALPPEVSSGRMYAGPGPATLLTASAGWDALAAELHSAADAYQEVVTGLTDESWTRSIVDVDGGRGRALLITAPCEEAAARATAAAAAYETAFAMTVPPPAMQANRVRLATLIATNFSGPEHAGDRGRRGGEVQRDVGSGCHGDVQLRRQCRHGLGRQGIDLAAAIGPSVGTKAQTTSTRPMSAVTGSRSSLPPPDHRTPTRTVEPGIDGGGLARQSRWARCRSRRVGPTRSQWPHRSPSLTPTPCPVGGARRRRWEPALFPGGRWGPSEPWGAGRASGGCNAADWVAPLADSEFAGRRITRSAAITKGPAHLWCAGPF